MGQHVVPVVQNERDHSQVAGQIEHEVAELGDAGGDRDHAQIHAVAPDRNPQVYNRLAGFFDINQFAPERSVGRSRLIYRFLDHR